MNNSNFENKFESKLFIENKDQIGDAVTAVEVTLDKLGVNEYR